MKQLPAGWKETTLGDVAIINPTESIKKGEVAKNIPMDFLDNFTRKISKYTEKQFSWGMKFRNWDTLFARITPCLENGKTAYVDILDDWEIAFWSTEYIVIREKKESSNGMFLYYLSVSPSFRDIAIKAMTWTSWRQRVQTDVLVNTKLLLPLLLPEQQAIAAVLSSFDDKIELLRVENQTLEQMGQELFKERFGKWKVGDELPEGWRAGKIEDLTNYIASWGTPATKESSYYGWRINWFSTKELQDCFLFSSEKAITEDALKNSSAKEFPKDTVLMAIYAAPTVWRLWILTQPSAFNQAAVGLVAKDDIWMPFIYLLLKFHRDNLNNLANWAAQQNLNVSLVKKYEIIIPDQESLSKFNLVIKPLFNKIGANSEQIQSLSATRDQLLPKLMSWEMRVEF